MQHSIENKFTSIFIHNGIWKESNKISIYWNISYRTSPGHVISCVVQENSVHYIHKYNQNYVYYTNISHSSIIYIILYILYREIELIQKC